LLERRIFRLWVFASMGSSWKKEKMRDIIFGKEERKIVE
jgi:hypothetical protein